MLNNQVFYHGIVKKAIVAFGTLFSNIYIDRRQGDSVTGTVAQRLQIPISYAPKEKWIVRIDSDPNLTQNTYTTLPRMSFEILGYNYDSTRKMNKMGQFTGSVNVNGTRAIARTPAPYNLDIQLYVLTKTQEDALQIIEQILPTFTPDYNLSVITDPALGVVQEIPVVLNSITVQDDYDGDFQTRRFVTHTLSFTIKLNLFGYTDPSGKVINKAIAKTHLAQDAQAETVTFDRTTWAQTNPAVPATFTWETDVF